MDRHDGDQQHQAAGVGQAVLHRVDADQGQHEQVAGDQEVRRHPFVPEVVVQRPSEQIREVEDPERPDEQPGGDERIRDQACHRGVHGPEDPLPAPARAVVTPSDRSRGQRDRRPGDEQQRDRHREQHVAHHVDAEEVVLVGVDRAAGDPEQQQQARDPEQRAVERPLIAAAAQPPHAGEVEEDAEPGRERPQQVEIPRRQPPIERQLGRQRRPGEQLGGRPHGRQVGRGRRGGAGQGGRGPARETHEREFQRHQSPEAPGGGILFHAPDQALAVPGPQEAQGDERPDLHEQDRAVR